MLNLAGKLEQTNTMREKHSIWNTVLIWNLLWILSLDGSFSLKMVGKVLLKQTTWSLIIDDNYPVYGCSGE